jgi:hypothetical protein
VIVNGNGVIRGVADNQRHLIAKPISDAAIQTNRVIVRIIPNDL